MEPQEVHALVDEATRPGASDEQCARVLRGIVPRHVVPARSIVLGISRLGALPQARQGLLLEWMALVVDLVDEVSSVRSLYGVLFATLVARAPLRARLCGLLMPLTTRRDATRHRVLQLQRLLAVEGSGSAVDALLACFLSLRLGAVPDAPQWRLAPVDVAWRWRICGAQADRGAKRPRVAPPHVLSALEAAGLPIGPHGAIGRGSLRGLQLWVGLLLWQQPPNDAEPTWAATALHAAATLGEYSGRLAPGVWPWLGRFLVRWNGVQHAATIVRLVEHLPPMDAGELRRAVLAPLLALVHTAGPRGRRAALRCIAALLRSERAAWNKPLHRAADAACAVALLIDRHCPATEGAVLELLEAAAPMVPSHGVVYLCALSPCPATLSRICGVLQTAAASPAVQDKAELALLHLYIQDMVGLLFSKQAFRSDRPTVVCNAPIFVREQHTGDSAALKVLRQQFVEHTLRAASIDPADSGGCLDLALLFAHQAVQVPGADSAALLCRLRDRLGLDGLCSFMHAHATALAVTTPPLPSSSTRRLSA